LTHRIFIVPFHNHPTRFTTAIVGRAGMLKRVVKSRRRILLMGLELGAGGSERQLAETAKALHASGWDVHVGCFRDSGFRVEELRKADIPIVRFPVRSFKSFSTVHGLGTFAQYVMRHDIALTHSFDTPLTIFGTMAARMTFRPVVLSSQRSYRDLFKPSERRLLRITDRLVDGIVVNCQAIRQHVVADEGMRPDRVHVCYNGLDTDKFFPARPPVLPEPLSGASIVIGTVAVLRPEKGLTTLFHAFAQVSREHPRVKLLIVGSGVMRRELETLASSLEIAANVHFEPATVDVTRWLHATDIFVLPSLSEALSNSLMEAMACGVTSVASSTGGNPELVRDGETGLLFAPGDADALAVQLRCLVENETLRRHLAHKAAAFIRSEMTIAKSAARMAEIYSGLLFP
jgi:glycosyltransferase involved in cell wall biosynthesis